MDRRIAVIVQRIQRDVRHAGTPLSLAKECNLSISRFYKLFREATGAAPATYVRSRRFERAKILVKDSSLSIKEIADLVGIHDDSHFVRRFEKLYGMSPRRFRRSLKTPSAASSIMDK